MPNATVTIRELKNKDTGLDLSVPSVKETTGLIKSTIEYHVVAVTNLQCFKSAVHKEKDVVQFMVTRHMEDIEDLRKKLVAKFSGTVLPQLPRTAITAVVLGESQTKEKQLGVEKFLHFVASVPKLAVCQPTLEFLGLTPLKAETFCFERREKSERYRLFEDSPGQSTANDFSSMQDNLFGDIGEEEQDLFSGSNSAKAKSDDLESQLFTATDDKNKTREVKLFDDQDFGGAITAEEADLFLIPGAATTGATSVIDTEDNSDLFNIDDDLDKLLTMELPKKKPSIPEKPAVKPKPRKSSDSEKPVVPPKPGPKPSIPAKPCKNIPVKPKADTLDLFSTDDPSTLGTDDIMKYIEENAAKVDDDVDLFS